MDELLRQAESSDACLTVLYIVGAFHDTLRHYSNNLKDLGDEWEREKDLRSEAVRHHRYRFDQLSYHFELATAGIAVGLPSTDGFPQNPPTFRQQTFLLVDSASQLIRQQLTRFDANDAPISSADWRVRLDEAAKTAHHFAAKLQTIVLQLEQLRLAKTETLRKVREDVHRVRVTF